MTNTATKTYLVGVIERIIVYYELKAEDARAAAQNWEDGEFEDRDDAALEAEGPCNVREQQADGSWRRIPRSEWEAEAVVSSDSAKDRYVIRSAEADGYWSNKAGWGGLEGADVFTASERKNLRLPIGGSWASLKPYSVLLHYPDYLDDTGNEIFYAWVEAPDSIAAATAAQRQAVAAQSIEIDDPADFYPLLVTEGHHYGQPLFNK